MRRSNSILKKVLPLMLTVVLTGSCLAVGCGKKAEEETHPAFLLSAAVDTMVANENGELPTQELTFESLNAEIDGEIVAKDVTLGKAFKDMKVESVTNDGRTVTVTVSGNADLTRETYNVPITGSVEIAKSYFGDAMPARGYITVKEPYDKEDGTDPVFWPYFDADVKKEGAQELHIILMPLCGEFAEDFSQDKITLGLDLEKAEITAFAKDEGNYDITIVAPDKKEKGEAFSYTGTITLAPGSMLGADGNPNAEALSVTRDYTPETEGRSAGASTGADAISIAGVVKGFGDISEGSLTGIIGGGASVFGGAWTVLGLAGLVPNSASVSQAIMDSLDQLHSEVAEVNENVEYCREVLDEHTAMLRNLGIQMDQYYLNDFNKDMVNMKSIMEEIDYGLQKNYDAIQTEVETLNAKYNGSSTTVVDKTNLVAEDGDGQAADDPTTAADDQTTAEDDQTTAADDQTTAAEEETTAAEEETTAAEEETTTTAAEEQTTEAETGPLDKVLTGQETEDMLFDLDVAIGAMPASANYTIGDKVKALKDAFNEVSGQLYNCSDNSNPINAYCNMHGETDNFATTSMDEKILYAAEIEYQLNRAVTYLQVLDGIEAHQTDVERLEGCIFPDVTVGALDGNGNPYCYVMNGYARLANWDEIKNLYWNPLDQKQAKSFRVLSEADENDFWNRMQGRTLNEELELSQMNLDNKGEGVDGDVARGITFDYYRYGTKGGWGEKTGDYLGDHIYSRPADNILEGDSSAYAICSYHFMRYDQNKQNCNENNTTCGDGCVDLYHTSRRTNGSRPMKTLIVP